MNNSSDIDTLHSQVVFLKMREKTTEELTIIWEQNDQNVWNKDELDAVQKVLLERLGRLPKQRKVFNDKGTKIPHFEFSVIDRITIVMFWFFFVLSAVLVIVSKILDSK